MKILSIPLEDNVIDAINDFKKYLQSCGLDTTGMDERKLLILMGRSLVFFLKKGKSKDNPLFQKNLFE